MIDFASLGEEMAAWRHALHADPEFGFEERRTATFVADRLRAFGCDEVAEGIGGTGVVATLRRGKDGCAVALRADMDALRIAEVPGRPHGSRHDGLMHACGHDGHTAALLGAAKALAMGGGFAGTVRFVFQPAEEWGRGAQAMLDDGLVERFPFDEIHGLHNMPGLAVGRLSARAGAVMSAEDVFEIVLSGRGGHASRPHEGREVLVAACALVLDLQTIVARRLSPTDVAVVSATEIDTDGTRNVLPGRARIAGDCRSFRPEISAAIEHEMRAIAAGIAMAHGLDVSVDYRREFVPLVNDAALVAEALAAARAALGPENVEIADAPMTASEDFARFLGRVPGSFVFIGNGEDGPPLHNPAYDFADAALVPAARYFVELVRRRLPVPG